MIIIVAKKPKPGAVKTRLCPPMTPPQAAKLAEAFLRETVRLASQTDEPLAIGFSPEEEIPWFQRQFPELMLLAQGDGDLGIRMAQLFEQAFGIGERAVVLIGADTPQLPTARLKEAIDALNDGADLVLGPSFDGGYYLVGLRTPKPAILQNIEWGTTAVLKQTLNRAENLGVTVTLLATERDIDEPADLEWLTSQSDDYAEMVKSTMRG